MGYFLPAGILEYFDLVRVIKDKEGLVLFLEERNELPEEFKGQHYHSKGFLPEVQVQDFPIRDQKAALSIKRRRWEDPGKGVIVPGIRGR